VPANLQRALNLIEFAVVLRGWDGRIAIIGDLFYHNNSSDNAQLYSHFSFNNCFIFWYHSNSKYLFMESETINASEK
jgi:hypothetical protein